VSAPAPGKGHDRWFAGDGLAGVADGATPLAGATDDPGRLAALILDELAATTDAPARHRLEAALMGLDPALATSGASATLAAVLDTTAGPRAIVLGDCEVHVIRQDTVLGVYDRRLGRLDARVLRSLRRRLARGEPAPAARADIEAELLANRSRLNTDGGYWAVDASGPAAARHAILRVVPRDFDGLVLASDGFARAWTVYEVTDPGRLSRETPAGLLEVIATLRRLERRDEHDPDRAQFSVSDDATAIIVVPEPSSP
jgi:hypothetical protein